MRAARSCSQPRPGDTRVCRGICGEHVSCRAVICSVFMSACSLEVNPSPLWVRPVMLHLNVKPCSGSCRLQKHIYLKNCSFSSLANFLGPSTARNQNKYIMHTYFSYFLPNQVPYFAPAVYIIYQTCSGRRALQLNFQDALQLTEHLWDGDESTSVQLHQNRIE